MRFHVLGNCQAQGIASCMSAMVDGLVTTYQEVRGSVLPFEADLIFAQSYVLPVMNDLETLKIRMFPRFVFQAFQPDAAYVGKSGNRVRTVLGDMNSSLVLCAWWQGLSPDETASLFRKDVMQHLAYLDQWDDSCAALFKEGDAVGLGLRNLLSVWSKRGSFTYTMNHPHVSVLWDIASALLMREGIKPQRDYAPGIVDDVLADNIHWPVYPPIADRLKIAGGFDFKAKGRSARRYTLAEFICESFKVYENEKKAGRPLEGFQAAALSDARFRNLRQFLHPKVVRGHVYAALPTFCHWRKSFQDVPSDLVDPVVRGDFLLSKEDRVATAGSCFAQHMSKALSSAGLNFFIAEPDSTSATFSARYGNIYTSTQLKQLFSRAYNLFEPQDTAWQRADGRWIDPFRPEIERAGFATPKEVDVSRLDHLAAVRKMFEELDVFVFTLGLTEGWRAKSDAAVFPLAPGISGGVFDDTKYEFFNANVATVVDDMGEFLSALRSVNPTARILLTVSPVPLMATYEQRHVLVSTTASKAILRAAADEICRSSGHVSYFPSYEIITGSFNRGRYYDDDLRSVTSTGVAHVMRLFLKHYADIDEVQTAEDLFDIVCEEEKLGI